MGFLSEIVRATEREVRSDAYGSSLPDRPARGNRPRFRAAIEADRASGALLVEYKRVSPGQSDPRLPVRSVSEFVRATEGAGITGYSCLATGPRFEGSPADVAGLADATSRPVLFKDFVVDPRQLEVARRAGAAAVLLIARLETAGLLSVPLSELAQRAHALDLEVLLEFHDKAELSVAERVAADMYGVNVRDLDSLAIERRTAGATIAEARMAGLEPLLGLSGVDGPAEAARFWRSGVDGILVGTAVARARDPARFLRGLHRSARGAPP